MNRLVFLPGKLYSLAHEQPDAFADHFDHRAAGGTANLAVQYWLGLLPERRVGLAARHHHSSDSFSTRLILPNRAMILWLADRLSAYSTSPSPLPAAPCGPRAGAAAPPPRGGW